MILQYNIQYIQYIGSEHHFQLGVISCLMALCVFVGGSLFATREIRTI